jgi:hypothetical protein
MNLGLMRERKKSRNGEEGMRSRDGEGRDEE